MEGNLNTKRADTYHSSSFVVVQIHLLPEAPPPLASIHEFSAELESKGDVIRASTPFPVPDAVRANNRRRIYSLRPPSVVTVIAIASLY